MDKILSQYMIDISKTALLDKDEELRLTKLARGGDKEARDKVCASNLKLVVDIAKKYSNQGVEFMDLVQEGNTGLLTAVDKYDPDTGYKFSTYATYWIRRAIITALNNQGRTIRIPVWMQERILKIKRVSASLMTELGRTPTDKEVADKVELTPEQVLEARSYAYEISSIDNYIGDGSASFHEYLPDEGNDSHEDVENRAVFSKMREYMQCLTDKEKFVISNRYGIGKESITLEEISKKLNLTPEGVRRIEKAALATLRRTMTR